MVDLSSSQTVNVHQAGFFLLFFTTQSHHKFSSRFPARTMEIPQIPHFGPGNITQKTLDSLDFIGFHWDLGKWQMTIITCNNYNYQTWNNTSDFLWLRMTSHDFAVLSIPQKVSFFLVATHGLQRYILHPGVEIVETRKVNHHHKWFMALF